MMNPTQHQPTAKLYYVIGPSGAGKDSLLIAARKRLADLPIIFSHRYITRAADAGGENFVHLSPNEFQLRQKYGAFWLTWQSHQLSYAIGCEVLMWLDKGLSVVMNGSRAYLAEAQQLADAASITLVPVWIHCDLPVLAQRLAARGRESEADIAERLGRAQAYLPPADAIIIDNSADFDAALTQLLNLLSSIPPKQP